MNSLFPTIIVNNSGCMYLFIRINFWLIDWLIDWLIGAFPFDCLSRGYTFLKKKNPKIFKFFSLPLEILGKASLDTWKFCKTVYTGNSKVKLNKYQDLWKFHNFFLNTHVNSIFLLQPWNFRWNLYVLNSTCLVFFWNNP